MSTFLVLIALISSFTLSPFQSSSSTFEDPNQVQLEMLEYNNGIVRILANELETKINKSGVILEITSKLPEVSTASFASSISPELHGIPQDADMPKRKVAKSILNTDKDFQVIFFLMPNGDVYLIEPYEQQQNLTGNNFAFRDYYKGAVGTGNTYLSDVIISAALGRPQANIAVPIYSENNGTLVGLWAGGLNLTTFTQSLQSLNLINNIDGQRIVIVDRQGQKIADSSSQSLLSNVTFNESFANLQSFRNSINGDSGTLMETINGTTMTISYHPVQAFSNKWAVLYLQPYDGSMVLNGNLSQQNDL
ncbi:MAG TPA: cache domain-containing protein, partial [Nitrososphaeraceae archaeon]|nr:cache domain-containing protein [Nitrososphaeraceae archaeon]